MKIDISGDHFDLDQNYTRVLLQQGRPILDRDWNEQTAIVLNQLRAAMRAIYGRHGGPAAEECGFIPVVKEVDGKNELHFMFGWYTIDGLVLTCGPAGSSDRKTLSYAELDPEAPNLPDDGRYLLYLEAMEREVTSVQQAGLLDKALPGVDLAARGQVVWRLRYEACSEQLTNEAKCQEVSSWVNWWIDDQRKRQRVKTIALPEGAGKAAVAALADVNLNRLFRIENHDTSTWKLSLDNGNALFAIEPALPAASRPAAAQENTYTIMVRLGGDDGAVLERQSDADPKIVVELLTAENVRFNQAGVLFDLVSTDSPKFTDFDAIDCRLLTLSGTLDGPGKFAFARIWNRVIEIAEINGYKPDPGDYWTFPIRSGAADIDDVGLRRPQHVYAPLGVIAMSEGIPDVVGRYQRIVSTPWREINDDYDLPEWARSRKGASLSKPAERRLEQR